MKLDIEYYIDKVNKIKLDDMLNNSKIIPTSDMDTTKKVVCVSKLYFVVFLMLFFIDLV